jgi:DNA repair photolyase
MQATTTIKQPKHPPTGTQEWAASNVNIQDGCEHDCRYCYAKTMAIRFKRMTAKSWAEPKLREHDVNRGFTRRSGRIMFPTAHDITEKNIDACLAVLKRMLVAGNDLLIVSKPCLPCVNRLCSELAPFRDQIVFRFSIGSASNAVLKFWEPGAPTFKQRLACLKAAYLHDFQTSVSCEPMLDDKIDRVVDAVHEFVTDSIWIGKINRLRSILPQNCPNDDDAFQRGEKLTASQNDTAIRALYARYKADPKIKWKDSIKKVVGIQRPMESGLDE